MHSHTSTILLAVLGLAGCGANVVLEPSGAFGDGGIMPRLPSDVLEPPAGCGTPRLVPTGRAWLAIQLERTDDGSLLPRECNEPTGPGVAIRRFGVADVYIDDLEVTNDCYSSCVVAGECTPSAEDSMGGAYAAIVDLGQAERFCEWRGGRLPTMLELSRASHGDKQHFTNPALYNKVVACQLGSWDDACYELADHTLGLRPAGTVPGDVGPFGHWDLVGGAHEASISYLQPFSSSTVCEYAQDSSDPLGFGAEEMALDPTARLYFVGVNQLLHWNWWGPGPHLVGNGAVFGEDAGTPVARSGFRCAYDPAYE